MVDRFEAIDQIFLTEDGYAVGVGVKGRSFRRERLAAETKDEATAMFPQEHLVELLIRIERLSSKHGFDRLTYKLKERRPHTYQI